MRFDLLEKPYFTDHLCERYNNSGKTGKLLASADLLKVCHFQHIGLFVFCRPIESMPLPAYRIVRFLLSSNSEHLKLNVFFFI